MSHINMYKHKYISIQVYICMCSHNKHVYQVTTHVSLGDHHNLLFYQKWSNTYTIMFRMELYSATYGLPNTNAHARDISLLCFLFIYNINLHDGPVGFLWVFSSTNWMQSSFLILIMPQESDGNNI
jgi:hypothetical protein